MSLLGTVLMFSGSSFVDDRCVHDSATAYPSQGPTQRYPTYDTFSCPGQAATELSKRSDSRVEKNN